MLRHFRLSKVSMGITMVLVLLSGILVGSFLPMIQANAESTSPVIVGKNLQLTFSATNSQQQTDWQIQFQANPQLTATRFKLEADNQAVTKIQQANQEIPADKDGYFELTKDQLQNASFTAAKNQDVKVTLATKNETETAFSPEGNGNFTISASAAGAVDESLEETVEPPTAETESSSSVDKNSSESSSSTESFSSEETNSSQTTGGSTTTAENNKSAKLLTKAGLGTGLTFVPKGAIQLSGMFNSIAKERPSGNIISSDQFVVAGDNTKVTDTGALQNNGMPYDEVVLSGANRAVGVWSKPDYRLNFNKSFNGRVYVNFGTQAADGFAFVMQNQGETPLTSSNTDNDGQNLGVYGSSGTGANPQSTAVQKSVAVEMDLHPNTSEKAQYDLKDTVTPHMAYSFPGSREGYRSDSIFSDEYWDLFSTAHIYHRGKQLLNGTIGDKVQDGTWYEFLYKFTYSGDASIFEYYLMNPATGAKTAATSIPWATMKSQLDLANNGNKSYWGFTAANGTNSGQIKFVFTQVPVDLGATVTNDVTVNNTSIVDITNSSTYNDSLSSVGYSKEVTLKSTFAIETGAEDAYNITKWESYLSPELYDFSKGIKDIKVNGVAYPGNISDISKISATGNVTVNLDPNKDTNLKVPIGGKTRLEFTATLKANGATTKTYFDSQITAKEAASTTADLRSFQSDEVSYWVKEIPKVTVIFQDTMGHEIKRQSGVNIPDGTSVNISNEINTLFTALGLDKYTALGANDTNNVRNSYGGYKLKNPLLYESFDSTKRDTDYNSGYIYDYNSSGQLEMRVTLLSPVSYTITMDAPNSGNSIADIIGWGDRIGFQTGNVAGKGGVQYANFANTENSITGEKAILTVSQYGNNITVYGMEGDQFDIRKWEFKYPIMNVTTETPNGTHVIGKIREDSALTLRTWNYGTNSSKVTEVDQQLGISGELSPKFMWYKDSSGSSHSLIVSPQTTDLNNDGKVDVVDSYQWLGVAPGWTLNLDGPKKLQFKLHLPDGSQKDSEDSVGAYPVHKMPTAGTVPNPLPEYPAYQQLYGIAGSETSIDALMTEYKDQLHQDYPASTFKLRQDSIETVKANQSFSDKAWDLLHLYFISNTLSLKGQFVDSSGNKIEGEFPVQTNADGTVEFAHKEDSTTVIVPFDTKTDENVNLQKLLKNSGKNIPAGYILAPDASFEYQLAENPDAIPIKLIKVDVPNTGIKNSSQNMTIILVVMSSVVSVGFYLYKRRQNI